MTAACTYPGVSTYPGLSTFPGCAPPPPLPSIPLSGGGGGSAPAGWFTATIPSPPPPVQWQLAPLPTPGQLREAAVGAVRGGALPLLIAGVILGAAVALAILADRQVRQRRHR